MASKILKNRPPVSLAAFARDVARRRAASGVSELPQNSGKRRTESKKALLKAIEKTEADWVSKSTL